MLPLVARLAQGMQKSGDVMYTQ